MTLRSKLIATALLAALLAPAAVQAQDRRAERPEYLTREFQVILINATPGELSIPDIPADAADALRDVSSVLPFRHFELLDTSWIRTHQGARARLGEAGAFEVLIEVNPGLSTEQGIHVQHFELDYREWREHPDPSVGGILYGDTMNLLASSFSIQVGETVVVGTSRVNGNDEALIVLLKAVK